MTFTLISKEDFESHSQTVAEKSFFQSTEMASLLEKRGFQVRYVGLRQSDGALAISSLIYQKKMTGGLYIELNSGPVSSDDRYLSDFYKGLKTYAKEQKALELVIKPYQTYQTFDDEGQATSEEKTNLITDLTDLGYQHDGLMTGYPGGEPDWHYHKDLRGLTADTLLSSFSKKGKPMVQRTKTFGIKLRRLKRDELALFKDITSATSTRRDYSDKSLDYYQDFYDSFKDQAEFMVASLNFKDYKTQLTAKKEALNDQISQLTNQLNENPNSKKLKTQMKEWLRQQETLEVRIAEANEFISQYGENDIILAGSLFIYTPQEAVYLFSGSYPEFNKFYAPVLLQEYVMQEAIKRQIPLYNFLGIMGIFDGSDGVLRFKQNFNGYAVRKMGTFRYYPSPFRYRLIQFLKKLLNRQ